MIFRLLCSTLIVVLLGAGPTLANAQQAAAPADGITMDMMPITQDQLTACRQQASSQLTDEQKTLHAREHGQDKDQMAKGAITGVTGAATSIISRKNNNCYWCGGNNNGANTAAATGQAQKSERNSQAVASTTATSQQVGVDAYQQCVNGIKGPEYVHFRQTGQMTAFTGGNVSMSSAVSAPQPGAAPSALATPAPLPTKSPIQDEGDGKHFILTAPGQTDSREVTRVVGSKNAYIEVSSGDKYIVMPDGSVTRIAHASKK